MSPRESDPWYTAERRVYICLLGELRLLYARREYDAVARAFNLVEELLADSPPTEIQYDFLDRIECNLTPQLSRRPDIVGPRALEILAMNKVVYVCPFITPEELERKYVRAACASLPGLREFWEREKPRMLFSNGRTIADGFAYKLFDFLKTRARDLDICSRVLAYVEAVSRKEREDLNPFHENFLGRMSELSMEQLLAMRRMLGKHSRRFGHGAFFCEPQFRVLIPVKSAWRAPPRRITRPSDESFMVELQLPESARHARPMWRLFYPDGREESGELYLHNEQAFDDYETRVCLFQSEWSATQDDPFGAYVIKTSVGSIHFPDLEFSILPEPAAHE